MVDTAKKYIGGVSSPKQTLLELLISEREGRRQVATTWRINPRNSSSPAPLSFSQQRLWFLDQLTPGSAVYNLPAVVHLSGDVNIKALEQTLSEIVRRHESLRTVIVTIDGRQAQVVSEPEPIRLGLEDLQALGEEARESEAQRLIQEEARRPFDLSRRPLLRARLLRKSHQRHVALLTMHHIVSDGWSMGLLIREISELYQAFSQGKASPLPELAIQYGDYTVWQREWLAGAELERQLEYWRKQLAELPVLKLPTDHPRPAAQNNRGASERFALTPETSQRLKALSRDENATLFIILLAGFQVLLGRYSGQDDIIVGSPFASRNRAETEGLIGFLVNTLVLRLDLSGNPTFREMAQRASRVVLDASGRQDIPFELLVESLRPQREVNSPPMFRVWFTLQSDPIRTLQLPGAKLSRMEMDNGAAIFDLTLLMLETKQGLQGTFQYDTDLYEQTTIQRLVRHFQKLIECVAEDPNRRIHNLPILTEQELDQLLFKWDEGEIASLGRRSIQRLFDAQVELRPERIAVECHGGQLSYAELNIRANRLANYLRRAFEIKPDDLIAVMSRPSDLYVIAILGVIKAGATYLPIDPLDTAERKAAIIEDATPRLLLVDSPVSLLDYDLPIFSLNLQLKTLKDAETDPVPVNDGGNLAYIIYTSGTTGEPKGVMVTHEGLANLAEQQIAAFAVRPEDRVLQFAPLNFDASVSEIFMALGGGATLCLEDRERLRLETELAEVLRGKAITVVTLPPAMLSVLSAENAGGGQTIISAGDHCPSQVVERWAPGRRFFNAYGPTEGTVCSTLTECSASHDDAERRDGPSIGSPMKNIQVYVLDDYLEPAPSGVTGELCLGGGGVARGYLNRPDVTAEKFIPDPLARQPGARAYRTGDHGFYGSDRRIKLLGRIDKQVKIRGYRVELGEIEAVIGRCPGIREVVVTVQESEGGEKRLAAYLTGQPDDLPTAAELRRYLSERLPVHMMPTTFTVMDQLPVSANGKIDRRALPAPSPQPDLPTLKDEFRAPRTQVEEVLAGIWADLLGVDLVGVEDNFFELGGHSLLATQVVSRIRDAFKVEIGLGKLFESPTVKEIAGIIEQQWRVEVEVNTPPLRVGMREGRIPLSFAQQRLWVIDQLEGTSAEYNLPMVWRLGGELDREAMERAINTIVERHETLRTRFAAVDGEPEQIIEPELRMEMPMEDLSMLTEEERERRVKTALRQEWEQAFDLMRGPLMRIKMLKVGAREHIMVRTMHHIVSDGWSVGVFNREFTILYEAYREGRENPLKPLAVQYADYSIWQRRWLEGGALDEGLKYWRKQLEAIPERLELPTDRPRSVMQTFEAAACRQVLVGEQVGALKKLCRENQVTLYMALLAVFGAALARYSGQGDIVVGSPVANRQDAQLEEMIGFFVNMLVMRMRVKPAMNFRESLGQVRQTTLEAYQHQDVPFERLVEELSPQRSLNTTPLFQVMFALQNAPRQQQRAEPLAVEMVKGEELRVRFDLEVHAMERDGQLELYWLYNCGLFDRWRIEQMARHYIRLLNAAAANPHQIILEADMLEPEERRQILTTWNEPARPLRPDAAPRLFEKQVERTPEAMAVSDQDQSLSYGALNERADQIARTLIRRGVEPGDIVGICLERSVEMVAAMLAILKAGAGYLPLDPTYPAERLAFMLKDAEPALTLCSGELPHRLPQTAAVLSLDEATIRMPARAIERDPDDAERLPDVLPEQTAYVIYTSGSTGAPKGVMVEHRALTAFFQAVAPHASFAPGDLHLAVTSIAFDISILELFLPLCSGAAVMIAGWEDAHDPVKLAALISRQQPNSMQATPSQWGMLIQTSAAYLGHVRVLVGGEPLPLELAQSLSLSGSGVHNLYGPTEATIWASVQKLTNRELANPTAGTITIGRPLADYKIYVLDQSLQLAPAGVVGELYIAGAGLARGYQNRPDLTAERFAVDPFGDEGGRMYRTGDLAQWDREGKLHFLGRVDQQVKIRGFRIETGEVEAVLSRHAAVAQAAVVAWEGRPGEKQLVGYVELRAERLTGSTQNGGHESEQIRAWQNLWEANYEEERELPREEDFRSWNSSYDNEPIALEEMREWRDETVERILALRPERVLEIGVGSGLLLWKIAPHCESYWGTDLSGAAIRSLREKVAQKATLREQVELRRQPADVMEGLPGGYFDTIVLNSVAQYFPNAGYLIEVVRGVIKLLAPGGRIYLGDVRNLNLLRCFSTGVALMRAGAGASAGELLRTITRNVRLEKELLLAPEFFVALQKEIGEIGGVDIRLKCGRSENELTKYRYEVALYKEPVKCLTLKDAPQWVWDGEVAEIEEVERRLESHRPDCLRIAEVPNRRLSGDLAAMEMLGRGQELQDVMPALARNGTGMDPEDFYEMGRRQGYRVGVTWSKRSEQGRFDVVMMQERLAEDAIWTDLYLGEPENAGWTGYANNPAAGQEVGAVTKELRRYIREQLPEYMVPTRLMLVDRLPLTINGKIDRRNLPPPEMTRSEGDPNGAPRTLFEEITAEAWAQELGSDQFGLFDNFFALGGHSLSAAKVISRLRKYFQVELTLRDIFDTPTVAQLSASIKSRLSADNGRELLPIRKVPREDWMPASLAQERLWFLDQLSPGDMAYNIPIAVRLTGNLDTVALESAVQKLVDRHETLRMRFKNVAGRLGQVIHPASEVRMALPEIEVAEGENQEAEVHRFLERETESPFDLELGPLLRVKLLNLGKTDHVLLIVIHHIVSDGWSIELMIREIATFYDAFLRGEKSPLPDLEIQYVDYAAWQKEYLQGEVFKEQLAYWRETLQGASAPSLPTDRARPAVQTFIGAMRRFKVPEETSRLVRELTQQEGMTTFMTTLAAFQILLQRYTGQDEFIIGTDIAARHRPETEQMLGCFFNLLPLRSDLAGDPTFRDLLRRVRAAAVGAYARQDVPFEMLIEFLQPERGEQYGSQSPRTPWLQTVFVFRHHTQGIPALPGLQLSPISLPNHSAKFDLTLIVAEGETDFTCDAEYNTDLFEASTINRLGEQYLALLTELVANPDQEISRIRMSATESDHQLIHSFMETDVA